MSTPFLAIFLTNQKNLSLLDTGYILSINPLINVCFGGFGGFLADKLSLKRIVGYIPIIWGTVFILFYFAAVHVIFSCLALLTDCVTRSLSQQAKKYSLPRLHRRIGCWYLI
ncbi:MFS transporter [Paenibacillus sp. P3E]|uniref:MFS transporter n=1 Tax=Paenibacillus sp. P3E TaxID=1349435 RepID=UPI003531EEF7